MKISIARDFSATPSGRYKRDGNFSGERFRQEFLMPALAEVRKSGGKVLVDLDDAEGFGASFLEEAFGGLVREGHITGKEANRLIDFTFTEPGLDTYVREIREYIEEAGARAA